MIMTKKKAKKVTTRIAPSPTGEFHIGSMRTLLYNWALARHYKGKFILRIEDTDKKREVKGAKARIKKVIKDYGLDWDEYFEQSERVSIYKKYALELVKKEKAYYCFCSESRLKKLREEQKKKGLPTTRYDKKCRSISQIAAEKRVDEGENFVIRLKVPESEKITYKDIVLGELTFESDEQEDIILLKSDGFPTYHLAVVVDDHLMEVTHVLRGNEWIPSTPKHVLLYKNFDWIMPKHGHLPNLKEVGTNKKMSKRYGDVHARVFLDKGFLPEALLNFLMLLGWNPGNDREFFTLDEFVKEFSLERIHKTDLVAFDRNKLEWMNGQYIKMLTEKEFAKKAKKFAPAGADEKFLEEIAPLLKTRMKKMTELTDLTEFFFKQGKVNNELFTEHWKKHLKAALDVLKGLEEWKLEKLNDELMRTIEKNNFKTGKFFMDLRIAVSGQKVTPPINESIIVLGKKETLSRIKSVL